MEDPLRMSDVKNEGDQFLVPRESGEARGQAGKGAIL